MLFRIENDLYDLMLLYKIDLSIFRQIGNADLVNHIESVGIVFYQRATQEVYGQ